ncbi:MAG TPA: 4Fe-4S binding protein [Anaerovoracaceae bacterium]|nr:4Fe-4S binding protein [Anaerovoracaceae bacterium]
MTQLNNFIKKFQVPEAAYRSIDRMFTEEEIEFVSRMEKETFTEEDLEAMGIVQGKRFIENSYRRGILSIANKDMETYRISDFYNRLDIFSISETENYKSLPEEDKKALDEWYFETYCNGLDQNLELPPTEDEILPLDEVLSFIDQQDRPVYLNYCDCRSLRGECGLPTKTCITYKNGLNSFAHRGLSEIIDKEKAKEVVINADKVGLIHTVNPNGICNCCGDCCYLFRGQRKRNSLGIWPKTAHVIDFDDAKCIQCGNCIKRCSFGVFKKEGNILADVNQCVGCGICVQGCPAKALTLKGR